MFKSFLPFCFACICMCSWQKMYSQTTTAATDSTGTDTYAMIIGISNYKFIRPLTYADRDAALFRDFLKSNGGGKLKEDQIFCLLNEDAKAANFWVKGMNWLRNKSLKKGDRLYIYLAGHGDAINQDEYFFLTYDCDPAGDKNNYIIGGNIQLYNLKIRIGELVRNGTEVILIMDACRSNELPGGTDGQNALNAAISEKKEGEIIMLATGAGQESLEDAAIGTGHGLFTYYLVDGLTGLADTKGNNDKKITLGELESYINANVPLIAKEKYNREQQPYFCCNEYSDKYISNVDSTFLHKWTTVKALKDLSGNEMDAIARGLKTRAVDGTISDTSFLSAFYRFNKAIKELNLVDSDSSAENYLQILNTYDPNNLLTKDARATLAAELINYAQTKINLYLQGKDAMAIQQIRSQFDDGEADDDINIALNRMEKIAKQDYNKTGQMLEKAIGYLDSRDTLLTKSIANKVYFFKAHGFFDKGNKTMDYALAMQYAQQANKYDNNAAYTLNTLSSLYIQNNQFDSAIYFAAKAATVAPNWRYPYLNLAYAYNKINIKDSALLFYQKALSVDTSNADAYVDLGRFYYQNRQIDSAVVNYNKALAIDKENLYAHNNLGWLLKEKRDYKNAIMHFRKSIDLDPTLFSSYNGLSKVFGEMKQFDSARFYYQKAMQKYPDKMVTSNYLGNFYKQLRQYDSAFYYYKQASLYDADDNIPFINIAKTYSDLKLYDSAINYYRYAAQTKSGYAMAYTELGLLYKNLKQYDSAVLCFSKASRNQPRYTPALNNLALSFLDQKKYDSANYYYRTALNIDPYNAYLYNNAALTYKEQFKLDSAKIYFKKAISINPAITSAYNNLGWLYRTQQKFDSAKLVFKQGIEKNPYNLDALNNLILLFKFLSQYDSAKIYYQKNIEHYPNNPNALNSIGNFYFEIKSFDSSIAAYKKALALDPEYAIAYNNLGAVYNEIVWYDSAMFFYKKAIALDSTYTNAHFNLGMSYYNAGKYDSAIVYLSNAIRLSPTTNYYYYFIACCQALKKRLPESISALQTAINKGYNDYYTILHDDDLKNIRPTKEYADLVKQYVPEKFIKQLQEEQVRNLSNKPEPDPKKKKKD